MLRSGGALAPISYSDSSPAWVDQTYYPSVGLSLTNAFASYAQVYKSQVWVATLVNKLAFGTARLPLKVYRRNPDGSRSDARDTPLATLLRNPNGRHDPFFFWLWTVSTFEVYGEALWVKVRPGPGRPPTQLWPLHPANIATKRDDDTGRLKYIYQYGTAVTDLLWWWEEDVVHFKSYNPDNQVRGMSRLEPLRQTVVNEDSARRAAGAMWANGGRPGAYLATDRALSQVATDRLAAQWAARHGGVDNWGKTAVLEEGLTPHFIPLNAEELQYIEARRMNREEACAVYDVPPPVVHILDRATFSNITEQMRSLYRDTMAPRLGLYESVLDTQLRPDFDPRGVLYAEFLLDEVLRGAFEVRAAANQSAIFSGQRTPNEVRRQDNLEPLPGGDRLYIQGAAIPLEKAGEVQARRATETAALALIEGTVVCGMCEAEADGSLSSRGLCRSCEGKVGRMLSNPKEIER